MKLLNLTSVITIGLSASVAFSSVDGVKKFVGKLPTGKVCQVVYGPAIPNGPGLWKIGGFNVDVSDRKFELTGSSLISSELNVAAGSVVGLGVINRKVVITSEVLGVGYETGLNVEFSAKLDSQSNPTEFSVAFQNYRNEYVFGSWVQGERGQLEVFICR